MSHHDEGEVKLSFFSNPLFYPERKPSDAGSYDEEAPKFNDVHFAEHHQPSVASSMSSRSAAYDEDGDPLPKFHHNHEATPIELFYDLFFVANLTTFTTNHNINTVHTLVSYIGFFCLLWFTWYQVTLYDVRFPKDSLFNRACKLGQFGVMVGFSIVGYQFSPSEVIENPSPFKAMTIILFVSRFLLAIQYIQTLWFIRAYKKAILPLGIIIGFTFVASIIYAGLFNSFGKESRQHAYVVWFVIAFLETVVTTVVSRRWAIIGFQGTHLGERMSLLTLIILGEGIILLMKAISYFEKGGYVWDSPTIGSVACGVLTIYFFYTIYFDRLHKGDFGHVTRKQIWSALHFPLHVALVLSLEGVRQFTIWGQAMRWAHTVIQTIVEHYSDIPGLQAFIQNQYWNTADKEDQDISAAQAKVNLAIAQYGNATTNQAIEEAVQNIFSPLFALDLEWLGIHLPHDSTNEEVPTTLHASGSVGSTDELLRMLSVFEMIFTYFYVVSGLTIIFIGIISWIARPPKTKGDYIRGAIGIILGIGVTLLSVLSMKIMDGKGVYDYSSGPWVLPTLVIVLAIISVVNHMKRPEHHHH